MKRVKFFTQLGDDYSTAVSLAYVHIAFGVFSVALGMAAQEFGCYLHQLGMCNWSGMIYLGTGVLGYTIGTETALSVIADYRNMSLIAVFVAAAQAAYGVVAGIYDYNQLENFVENLDSTKQTFAVDCVVVLVALVEVAISITSAVISTRLVPTTRDGEGYSELLQMDDDALENLNEEINEKTSSPVEG